MLGKLRTVTWLLLGAIALYWAVTTFANPGASVLSSGFDNDGDGCTDVAEQQPKSEAATGGGRDPNYYWDFMDMWAGQEKDRRVNIIDIGAIVSRFGATDADGTADPNRNSDPLDPPQLPTGYHPSADRSPPKLEANPWSAGPPDGDINIIEIGTAIIQFGHNCSGLPLKPTSTPTLAATPATTPTLAATPAATPPPTATPCPQFVPGDVIVAFESGTTPERVAEIVESVGATNLEFLFDFGSGPIYIVNVPVGQELETVALFKTFPEVKSAQPNFLYCIDPPL